MKSWAPLKMLSFGGFCASQIVEASFGYLVIDQTDRLSKSA